MTATDARPGVAFPVGATHPTPDVETWLDERTEAELQPPCDRIDYKWTVGRPETKRAVAHCAKPAAYILRTACGRCGLERVILRCLGHHLAPPRNCRQCNTEHVTVLIHVEPLR